MERLRPLVALALALGLGCGAPAVEDDAGVADGATPDMPVLDSSSEDEGAPNEDAGQDQGRDEGVACVCTGVSTCCDGCQPRAALTWCHAGGSTYGRCSTVGTCNTGAPGAPVTCAADACHAVNESALPSCVLVPANNGGECNDGVATTFGDTCNAAGTCAGTSCVSSPPCITRSWNGSACISTPQTGTSCDDGNVSTHTDECQANGSCAGTACECTTGPCCDGCFFRPSTHVCDPMRPTLSVCASGAAACGTRGIESRHESVRCSGASSACNGAAAAVAGAVVVECGAGEGCFNTNPMPFQAECFGCP